MKQSTRIDIDKGLENYFSMELGCHKRKLIILLFLESINYTSGSRAPLSLVSSCVVGHLTLLFNATCGSASVMDFKESIQMKLLLVYVHKHQCSVRPNPANESTK